MERVPGRNFCREILVMQLRNLVCSFVLINLWSQSHGWVRLHSDRAVARELVVYREAKKLLKRPSHIGLQVTWKLSPLSTVVRKQLNVGLFWSSGSSEKMGLDDMLSLHPLMSSSITSRKWEWLGLPNNSWLSLVSGAWRPLADPETWSRTGCPRSEYTGARFMCAARLDGQLNLCR